ncbi:MAG: hypothetical protein BWX69_02715 [Planctomycetes bacterium ADurb.Bin069]|nr:MAG: hypothetical protein BWX69_02715 [Planctomycetes bacterium ADurb.Bin069]
MQRAGALAPERFVEEQREGPQTLAVAHVARKGRDAGDVARLGVDAAVELRRRSEAALALQGAIDARQGERVEVGGEPFPSPGGVQKPRQRAGGDAVAGGKPRAVLDDEALAGDKQRVEAGADGAGAGRGAAFPELDGAHGAEQELGVQVLAVLVDDGQRAGQGRIVADEELRAGGRRRGGPGGAAHGAPHGDSLAAQHGREGVREEHRGIVDGHVVPPRTRVLVDRAREGDLVGARPARDDDFGLRLGGGDGRAAQDDRRAVGRHGDEGGSVGRAGRHGDVHAVVVEAQRRDLGRVPTGLLRPVPGGAEALVVEEGVVRDQVARDRVDAGGAQSLGPGAQDGLRVAVETPGNIRVAAAAHDEIARDGAAAGRRRGGQGGLEDVLLAEVVERRGGGEKLEVGGGGERRVGGDFRAGRAVVGDDADARPLDVAAVAGQKRRDGVLERRRRRGFAGERRPAPHGGRERGGGEQHVLGARAGSPLHREAVYNAGRGGASAGWAAGGTRRGR